ncbi:MAG: enoyl-CoA hydratase/isomerase family protein [candidate division Zixibacteria bacterium]|nr:enoyl-CoA hydratase/isomerase family protein [candidate division Zixibacteria bacterium]
MTSNDRSSVFESSGDYLDSYVEDGVGVIHLKDKVFEMATNLSLKAALFEKIKIAEESPVIKVLLVMSDESILGEEKYAQFWTDTVEARDGNQQTSRQVNALAQYIEMMCGYGKIVVSAVRGSVVGAFLGAILSTDFRVVSENTVFSFPHMQYGMPPQGALAFLLPRYIGIAKAKSILLRAEPILASQALDLGLVDNIVSNTGFEKACLEFARELTHLAPEVVGMTKRLFECSMKELHTYFELEAKLVGLHKVKLPPD